MPLTAAPPLRQDLEVISLVGLAHGTSHFFHLLLPSLFPWLMLDFGLGFTQAGALSTAFYVTSGAGQAAAGFLVDRLGARRVLLSGVGLFGLAAIVLGLARGYGGLLLAAVLAGAANSVFHPSDFTLLNRRVSSPRLGHAFSAHALSGNIAWAAAPLFLTTLAAGLGWRAGAFCAAAVPVVPFALLALRGDAIADRQARSGEPASTRDAAPTFAFLGLGAVWTCFLFFLVSTMAFGALQNFGPPVFRQSYRLPLGAAASALTAYLLGSAAGIVAGGFLAAGREAHERVIAVGLSAAALAALVLASGAVPAWSVLPAMAFIGFCTGGATPSRDLLVRHAALARAGAGAFGRVYGFVYSGLDVGQALFGQTPFGHSPEMPFGKKVVGKSWTFVTQPCESQHWWYVKLETRLSTNFTSASPAPAASKRARTS